MLKWTSRIRLDLLPHGERAFKDYFETLGIVPPAIRNQTVTLTLEQAARIFANPLHQGWATIFRDPEIDVVDSEMA